MGATIRTSRLIEALRALALARPGAEEGVACPGTAVESHAFRAKKKAFLFVRRKGEGLGTMLKLAASLPEAQKLETEFPGRYVVGAHGWVTTTFVGDDDLPHALFERWIDESYRAAIGGARAEPAAAKRPAAKRATPKSQASSSSGKKTTSAARTRARG